MTDTVSFLRNVPVLGGLSDQLLEQLFAQARIVTVRAAEWIMREGEAADSMYIVRSGRVEIVDEGPPETVIRVLRRGEVLGELALLREGTRSASARARRDAELLELGRPAFERLILSEPSFALGLTRAMGAQLAASRAPALRASPPRTIAVVGLDRAALAAEVAAEFADALSAYGSAAILRSGELGEIDRAERDSDRVILAPGGDAPPTEWTNLCIREADVVIAVTTGAPDRGWLERAATLDGCELLVVGPRIEDSIAAAMRPRQVQVVAQRERRGAIDETARRLAGRSLGVVLSGGGARALAHIGVLEELQAAGLRIGRVGGVSLGSLVAASLAVGYSPEETYRAFERNFVATNPTNDYAVPAYSLIRGAKTRRLLTDAFGDQRIEELRRRLFTLSCDLIGRRTVLHSTGRVVDAVYASLAMPGVFPPVATADGRLLVDGGVLDNLPVEVMARTGEGPVIAVDVTGRIGALDGAGRPLTARLGGPIRRLLTGSEAAIPRLGETIMRTVTVGSIDTVAAARMHADMVITPAVGGFGLMDWKVLPRVVELGRRAAREALAAKPELVERLGA